MRICLTEDNNIKLFNKFVYVCDYFLIKSVIICVLNLGLEMLYYVAKVKRYYYLYDTYVVGYKNVELKGFSLKSQSSGGK